MDGFVQAGNLLLGKFQRIQVALDARAFGCVERQRQPPGASLGQEGGALRRQGLAAVQNGVQAVLGLCRQAGHFAALGDQRASVAHWLGRNPDAHQQAFGQKARQNGGGDLVVHHLRTGDQRDVRRVHHRDRLDVRQEVLIHLPRVGGHFYHQRIL